MVVYDVTHTSVLTQNPRCSEHPDWIAVYTDAVSTRHSKTCEPLIYILHIFLFPTRIFVSQPFDHTLLCRRAWWCSQ